MNVRNLYQSTRLLINKHSAVVTLVTLILLSITAVDIVQQMRRPQFNGGNIDSYYYDLETDRLFIAKSAGLPPIAGPGSGGPDDLTGVRAYVFACKDCNDAHDRYIGWVEGYSPEARESFQRMMTADHHAVGPVEPMFPPFMAEQGHLVALPDPNDPKWKENFHPFNTPEAMDIMRKSQQHCGATPPMACVP